MNDKPSKKKRPLDADTLWQLQRVGSLALAPDGRRAVCTLTQPDMAKNTSSTALWLLDTSGATPPKPLTRCGDKDGQPAWSPRGDQIAFVARREQQGAKDKTPQLYLIAPDGGEARRASDFAPGIESFKWLPDGRRIVFAAWTWPQLKGAAAQAQAHQDFAARKESGYATDQAFYRHWDHDVPMGRVLHLWLLDTATGRATDLFEGTAYELPRDCDGNDAYDPHPDGRRLVFQHDPAAVPMAGNRLALAELQLRTRQIRALADDPAWDYAGPRHAPDGRLACTAAHVAEHHTAPRRLALLDGQGRRQLFGEAWDHEVDTPLRWADDGSAVLFAAEQRGRRHLWRCRLADGDIATVHRGGWVQGFDLAAGTQLVAADSALHPARVTAQRADEAAPRRIEAFNDQLLAGLALGEVRETEVSGALGDAVQLWLTLPPGFDAKKKHPVIHVIHGGPFTAAGDSFSWRWNPHVFAAQGHVVAQVNYHGSSGFGWAFKHSLIGRQGQLELQDIEAATDWLLRQRWVDRKRIVATGGSYGGFLVAWMNGHVAPGRYQAYVCHAGVFDRIATFAADSWPVRPKDLGARYWEDMGHVLSQSPMAFAGRMQTPTLVIHGAKDYRVPDCNGLAYYNTLKARGVDARLLWFADENHWVLKPQNARQWYGEFMDWVGRHTGLTR